MTDEPTEPEALAEPIVQWQPNRRALVSAEGARAQGGSAVGSAVVGALALGAMAVGALAIGALAVGRLSIGKAAVRHARFGRLEVDDLVVRRFSVLERGPPRGRSG